MRVCRVLFIYTRTFRYCRRVSYYFFVSRNILLIFSFFFLFLLLFNPKSVPSGRRRIRIVRAHQPPRATGQLGRLVFSTCYFCVDFSKPLCQLGLPRWSRIDDHIKSHRGTTILCGNNNYTVSARARGI